MPDITMCVQLLCPKAGVCHRVQATPNQNRQSYCAFDYRIAADGSVECDHYWSTDRKVVADSPQKP